MLATICEDIKKQTKAQILLEEPMSKHTSFKIGGIAEAFIKITTLEQLQYICKVCKEKNIPYAVIGNGTNLLVRDKRY